MPEDTILGIDPGYDRMGYGVIKHVKGEWKLLGYGCVQTSKDQTMSERLLEISNDLQSIITKYKPIAVGVEDLFFSKNVKTAIKVAEARGVILCSAQKNKLEIFEFTPLQIKQQIAGNGRADKTQVQILSAMMLGLKDKLKQDDAADAVAVAICAGQKYLNEQKIK